MNPDTCLKILVVDDEEIVRYTMGELLKAIGHQPEFCEDGLSALEAIKKIVYDIVFVDIRMPGMNGFTFLDQAHKWRPHLPIIVVSGHGDDETRIKAVQAGAFSFIAKPFKLADLDELIQDFTKGQQAVQHG